MSTVSKTIEFSAMPPDNSKWTTAFAVPEKYAYLSGLGNHHSSEAVPNANPVANNNPQHPPYDLKVERISGTSFTAPRHKNYQSWLYRITPSYEHSEYEPFGDPTPRATHYTPNAYLWPPASVNEDADFTEQKLIAQNADPMTKSGVSIWIFSATKDMPNNTAYASLDGETLILPQVGALDIRTELGHLLVRQNEFAVIPKGVKYRVVLPSGPARGYVCELHQGHFQLPDLGIIGTTGLANVRDFRIPVASFEGRIEDEIAKPLNDEEWTILVRQAGRLWKATQNHTPFDVVAWNGTSYPYKFDFARFNVLGNMMFDEHDPSLYVVMTAPSGKPDGSAVVDFAVIPPRWNVAEDTLWLPYYHRNTMTEFFVPVINQQDPEHPFNSMKDLFLPFTAGMNGPMITHGSPPEELEETKASSTAPRKIQTDGFSICLFETELPLYLSDWAADSAIKNFNKEPKAKI